MSRYRQSPAGLLPVGADTSARRKYMNNLSEFCSCTNMKCPLHPTMHDKGCAPCIKKNLGLNEIPNCFFNLLEGADTRSGDSFRDFAHLVLRKQE